MESFNWSTNSREIPNTDAGHVIGSYERMAIAGNAEHYLFPILIRFPNGSRTRWHMHDYDQVIYVVEGEGLVGTRERLVRAFPGDVVHLPAGEEHWHGSPRGKDVLMFNALGPYFQGGTHWSEDLSDPVGPGDD